jgi:hypothetical protein
MCALGLDELMQQRFVVERLEPAQHVENMVGAHPPGLQRQLHGHQHVIERIQGDAHEHLGHHTIAARVAQQVRLQMLHGLGYGLEGGAVARNAGLALEQADVVPPVVQGLPSLEATRQAHNMFGCLGDGAGHHQAIGTSAHADTGVSALARHAVAVALVMEQRGGRRPGHLLHIAIEGCRIGYQVHLLLLPDIGNGQL